MSNVLCDFQNYMKNRKLLFTIHNLARIEDDTEVMNFFKKYNKCIHLITDEDKLLFTKFQLKYII